MRISGMENGIAVLGGIRSNHFPLPQFHLTIIGLVLFLSAVIHRYAPIQRV